jgi:hypothetical protein
MARHFSRQSLHRRAALAACSTLTLAVLTACGGGSGDGGNNNGGGRLDITGLLSAGTASSASAVRARCAQGSGSTTTAADGGFTLSIEGGVLPCALQAEAADGTLMHGAATDSASAVGVRINPLTELLLAQHAGRSTGGWFDAFDAAAAAAFTTEAMQAAQAAVAPVYAAAGIEASTLGDVFTADTGMAQQALLDAIDAHGSTLQAISDAVAAGSANSAEVSNTPALPAASLLQPAAGNCASARSGIFRVISPIPDGGSFQISRVAFNATTLVSTDLDDQSQTPYAASGDCRFVEEGSATPTEFVVSGSGAGVSRYFDEEAGVWRMSVFFAEQAFTVAELAGNWNFSGMEARTAVPGTFGGAMETASVDAAGKVTVAGVSEDIVLKPNADDGFDMVNSTAGWTDRVFAFRAGGGERMMAIVSNGGSFRIATPSRALALPVVGDVTRAWVTGFDARLASANAQSLGEYTVTAVDEAQQSWVRRDESSGVLQTLKANDPLEGWSFRAAGTGTNRDGQQVQIREATRLQLRGVGLVTAWLPASSEFFVSAIAP